MLIAGLVVLGGVEKSARGVRIFALIFKENVDVQFVVLISQRIFKTPIAIDRICSVCHFPGVFSSIFGVYDSKIIILFALISQKYQKVRKSKDFGKKSHFSIVLFF